VVCRRLSAGTSAAQFRHELLLVLSAGTALRLFRPTQTLGYDLSLGLGSSFAKQDFIMSLFFLILAVVCLAYANGANDNFKGVATLFGSGTTTLKSAVVWATLTTLLGSLAAVILASELLQSFSGRGLVANDLVTNIEYVSAVAMGAGLTVLLATWLGLPISTTHSLVGALVGAGWAAGSAINFSKLGTSFFLPLLVSPALALGVTCVLYPAFRSLRLWLGISEETCLCVGQEVLEVVPAGMESCALQRIEQLSVTVDDNVICRNRYNGRVLGLDATAVLDRLHFVTAGIVSFARGLNDTPKIAALLLVAPLLNGFLSTALIGLFIAAGGLLSVRKIAETMSHKITSMNHGQGFTANLITSCIVICATRFGLPVSTTHVSCGALFGIGAVTRKAHWKMIGTILLAWLTTLPAGALLGAASYLILSAW
jgi:PiT family inorganic phosphate transporter